jgi:hypothetical protein
LGARDGGGGGKADARKARLSETLRANLLKRKAQARARRQGDADRRPEGISTAKDKKEG